MPDNDKRKEPGSITKTADAQNERISGISNVSQTVTEMQKTTQRQIEETKESIDYGASTGTTSREMNNTLSRFGKTITAFTKGIEDISLSTARATKDAIGEYGKAIGQDISYNKQNIVAMALSRTTPLFGYFAAKFMETDVFKKAKERMSESIANTFRGIGSSISNIFKGGKDAKEAVKEKVPKMQKGGYIEKGGMIEVHPAEVVMPIEKLLARIDDSISIGKEIAQITSKTQMQSLAKMSKFVSAERDKEPVGMVKGFLRAMREVQSQYQEPANIRMLRAVLSIQDTLGATIGTWEQVWTKLLVEHPTFRQITFAMKTMGSIFSSPFKFVWQIFKRRGGYRGHLSRSSNPFQALNENIGLLYTGSMWRLDNVAKFTKISAEAARDLSSFVTGKQYPSVEGIGSGAWSLFRLARSGISLISKPLHFLASKSKFTKWMTASLETPFENIFYKIFRHNREMKELYGDVYGGTKKAAEKAIANRKDTAEGIKDIAKITRRKWAWEKIQASRKGLKSIFSWIWKMLVGGGGFLKSILGFGAGGMLGKGVASLFAKGGAIALGVSSLFAKGGAITLGIATALGAGAAIGTILDKYFFAPARKKMFAEIDILTAQIRKKNDIENQKVIGGIASSSGMKQYSDYLQLRLMTGISSMAGTRGGGMSSKDREHKLGRAGTYAPRLIKESQQNYMLSNLSEYLKYDPEVVEIMRSMWQSQAPAFGFYSRTTDKNIQEYAIKREKSFLSYLNQYATPMTDAERQVIFKKHANVREKITQFTSDTKDWIAEKGKYAITKAGQIVEKASGKIIKSKDLAKMQASELLTTSKLLTQEMKKRGIEEIEGLKGLGDQLQQNLSQVTNVINNQTTQVTRVFNSGAEKAGTMLDEMSQRIVTGNFH